MMHPYRTACPPPPEPDAAVPEDGGRLAFGVLTFVGGVQVAVGLFAVSPVWQTLFGAACVLAGIRWLIRHRPSRRRAVG